VRRGGLCGRPGATTRFLLPRPEMRHANRGATGCPGGVVAPFGAQAIRDGVRHWLVLLYGMHDIVSAVDITRSFSLICNLFAKLRSYGPRLALTEGGSNP